MNFFFHYFFEILMFFGVITKSFTPLFQNVENLPKKKEVLFQRVFCTIFAHKNSVLLTFFLNVEN